MCLRKSSRIATIVCSVGFGAALANGQGVVHVDDDAPLGGDGSTWPTAYKYLQDALAVSGAGDAIRVAGGVYRPDQDEAGNVTPGDRAATFQLINGVAVYGGYAGLDNPENPTERNIDLYESTLSGDLNGDDGPDFGNNTENSYHVLTGNHPHETAVLDGLTIRSGNADELYPHCNGGGLLNEDGSPILRNCTFRANATRNVGGAVCNVTGNLTLTGCVFIGNSAQQNGGGIYSGDGTSTTLTGCVFRDNSARWSGGGMHASRATFSDCMFRRNVAEQGGGLALTGPSAALANCTFDRNSATGQYEAGGGIMSGCGSSLTLVNCAFSDNSATGQHGLGGGMTAWSTAATLVNCTFAGNAATDGRALATQTCLGGLPCAIQVENSVLWDGGDEVVGPPAVTITFSDVQGGWAGVGNIDDDPLFLLGPAGCHYLSQTAAAQAGQSPCVDAGSVPAADLGLDTMTTRSDEDADTGLVDMGYHYAVINQPLVMGDFNRDRYVDLLDYAELPDCITGPSAAAPSPCCRIFDWNFDAHVDLRDFAAFEREFDP